MCVCVYDAVEDWDLYQRLIDHLYRRHLKTTPTEHPVLMSEPPVSRTHMTQWLLCLYSTSVANMVGSFIALYGNSKEMGSCFVQKTVEVLK